MIWRRVKRTDEAGRSLADRHYSRQKPGAAGFVPPGRCLVLVTECRRAVWVTSWPFPEYVKHAWAGAWINSLFRNEGAGLSSDLIKAAVAHTRHVWPEVPADGMVTFVKADAVREKKHPGRCYQKAGFSFVGFTQGGLIAWQLLEKDMPPPCAMGGMK